MYEFSMIYLGFTLGMGVMILLLAFGVFNDSGELTEKISIIMPMLVAYGQNHSQIEVLSKIVLVHELTGVPTKQLWQEYNSLVDKSFQIQLDNLDSL